MKSLRDRMQSLVNAVNERELRAKKSNELRQLTIDFSFSNRRLSEAALTSRFVLELTNDAKLGKMHDEVKENYSQLKKELTNLWGKNGEHIDILEPGEFSSAINNLTGMAEKLESKSSEIIQKKIGDAKAELGIAETFSLIPDLGLNLKPFEDAFGFLDNAIHLRIPNFLGKTKKEYDDRGETWRHIEKELKEERIKMDLQHMKGKKISLETLGFIKKFMTDRVVSFELLDSKIVEELKDKFPELSGKLRVSIS